jgi:hypothetical protein
MMEAFMGYDGGFVNFNLISDGFYHHPNVVDVGTRSEIVVGLLPFFTEEILQEKLASIQQNDMNKYGKTDAVLAALRHLEESGALGLPFMGPFSSLCGAARVTTCRVRRGARIASTSARNERTETKASITIRRVYGCYHGYLNGRDLQDACVVWAGSGGYWSETSFNNLEWITFSHS